MTGAVHIEIETRQLKLKEPFVIAGASADEKPMALVRLRQETSGGGVLEGLGEASLSIKSAESFEKNLDFLHNLPEDLFDDPTRIKDIADRLDRLERGCRPAKCAVDLALYDLNGKMLERPVEIASSTIPSTSAVRAARAGINLKREPAALTRTGRSRRPARPPRPPGGSSRSAERQVIFLLSFLRGPTRSTTFFINFIHILPTLIITINA